MKKNDENLVLKPKMAFLNGFGFGADVAGKKSEYLNLTKVELFFKAIDV